MVGNKWEVEKCVLNILYKIYNELKKKEREKIRKIVLIFEIFIYGWLLY